MVSLLLRQYIFDVIGIEAWQAVFAMLHQIFNAITNWILSTEISDFLQKKIFCQVILSKVEKYCIFSLVTDTIYIFSKYQIVAVLTTLSLISYLKDLEWSVHDWHYAADLLTSNQALTSRLTRVTLSCTQSQSNGSFNQLFYIANFFLLIC